MIEFIQRVNLRNSDEYFYKDVTVFTVDMNTGARKDLFRYEDAALPYLTTAAVNMSEGHGDYNYKNYVGMQFVKHDVARTEGGYVFKGGKAYYLGKTDEEKAAFEKEFGGLDPVFN